MLSLLSMSYTNSIVSFQNTYVYIYLILPPSLLKCWGHFGISCKGTRPPSSGESLIYCSQNFTANQRAGDWPQATPRPLLINYFITLDLAVSVSWHGYQKHLQRSLSQLARDSIITSSLSRNDVATLFRRNNDVIIASRVHWVIINIYWYSIYHTWKL